MPTGIEKLPAASAASRWVSTMIAPPVLVATCEPSNASGGQMLVTDVGIASRLNQYGNWRSLWGMVPLACRIVGCPTTTLGGGESFSVNPSPEAGAAGAPSASRPRAADRVHRRA